MPNPSNSFALLEGEDGDDVANLLVRLVAKVDASFQPVTEETNDKTNQPASKSKPKFDYARGERGARGKGRGRGRGRGSRGLGFRTYNNGQYSDYQRNYHKSTGYQRYSGAVNGHQSGANGYQPNGNHGYGYRRHYNGQAGGYYGHTGDWEGQGPRRGRKQFNDNSGSTDEGEIAYENQQNKMVSNGAQEYFNEPYSYGDRRRFRNSSYPRKPRQNGRNGDSRRNKAGVEDAKEVSEDNGSNGQQTVGTENDMEAAFNGEDGQKSTGAENDSNVVERSSTEESKAVESSEKDKAEDKKKNEKKNKNKDGRPWVKETAEQRTERLERERAEDATKMTLEQYEKLFAEKRRALDALKSDERKVTLEKDFQSMQIVGKNRDLMAKSEADNLKKTNNLEKDGKVRKSVSFDEFFKPASGERHSGGGYNRGGYARDGYTGDREPVEVRRGYSNNGIAGGRAPRAPGAKDLDDFEKFPTLGGLPRN